MANEDPRSLKANRLLAGLDAATGVEMAARTTRVTMRVHDLVYENNLPFEYAYFPIDCVLSMVALLEDAPESSIEVATVGNEGMIGLPLFLGADVTPGRAFAQVAGDSFRIAADDFRAVLAKSLPLHRALHRYTQAMLVQVSQSTACNRVHSLRERCARWLLMTHDRVSGDEFDLTQEFLGQMLGERRPAVNAVASALQEEGAISYVRGHMRILERGALERAACSCYRVVSDEYARMLADVAAS